MHSYLYRYLRTLPVRCITYLQGASYREEGVCIYLQGSIISIIVASVALLGCMVMVSERAFPATPSLCGTHPTYLAWLTGVCLW